MRTVFFDRKPGDAEALWLRELRRLLREGEAADACRKMGARPVFLNMPFYGDGSGGSPVGAADVALALAALQADRDVADRLDDAVRGRKADRETLYIG